MYPLFDEPKISSKTMIAFSNSFRGFLSSLISFFLILEFEYCSGGDLVNIQKSQWGSRELIFTMKCVLPENLGPTNNVGLFMCSSFTDIFSEF